MPTKGLFEEGKERPGRRSRRSVEAGERNRQDSALLQWSTKAAYRQWRIEALAACSKLLQRLWRASIYYVPWDVTKKVEDGGAMEIWQ
jgi:hypothetical protein